MKEYSTNLEQSIMKQQIAATQQGDMQSDGASEVGSEAGSDRRARSTSPFDGFKRPVEPRAFGVRQYNPRGAPVFESALYF